MRAPPVRATPTSTLPQFYYIEPASLVRHNLTMLQGSARVGKPDPWQSSILRERGLSHLLVHKRVPARTVGEILEQEGVRSVGYFKIDLNGIEPPILRSLHAACEAQPALWPQRLAYEQGAMDRSVNKRALIRMFREHGYEPELKPAHIFRRGHSRRYSHLNFDMVMSRNLTRPSTPG